MRFALRCGRHGESLNGNATMTPFSGCRGLVRFSRSKNPSQPARSTARVGILCRVAPRRVDQHGVLGEPPVAQPRAADARQSPPVPFVCRGKAQAGIQQRRRLAGPWRTDDRVPGLFGTECRDCAARSSADPAPWSDDAAGPELPRSLPPTVPQFRERVPHRGDGVGYRGTDCCRPMTAAGHRRQRAAAIVPRSQAAMARATTPGQPAKQCRPG